MQVSVSESRLLRIRRGLSHRKGAISVSKRSSVTASGLISRRPGCWGWLITWVSSCRDTWTLKPRMLPWKITVNVLRAVCIYLRVSKCVFVCVQVYICSKGRGGADTCLACRRCPEMVETCKKSIIQRGKMWRRGEPWVKLKACFLW